MKRYSGFGVCGIAGILSGMDATPERRLFQIHLSTAIVLMFVAGGLMGLNFATWHGTKVYIMKDGVGTRFVVPTREYGWPFLEHGEWNWQGYGHHIENPLAPLWNELSALGVTAFAASFMEYLIRRREARKP